MRILVILRGAVRQFFDEVPVDPPIDQKINNVLVQFEIRLENIRHIDWLPINLKWKA